MTAQQAHWQTGQGCMGAGIWQMPSGWRAVPESASMQNPPSVPLHMAVAGM